MPPLVLCRDHAILHDGDRWFDPWTLAWQPSDAPLPDGEPVSPAQAVGWLFGEAKARHVPIGVIGPRQATPLQIEVAERLGKRLGEIGIIVLNGGKTGVMEAVSKGCMESGGQVIGLVPDEKWSCANPYVTIPLATGIGPARNVLIARSSMALVAIGGGYGTLSEIALGLHFDKPVFSLEGAPEVKGAQRMESVDQVMNALMLVILQQQG